MVKLLIYKFNDFLVIKSYPSSYPSVFDGVGEQGSSFLVLSKKLERFWEG